MLGDHDGFFFAVEAGGGKAGEVTVVINTDVVQEGVVKFLAGARDNPMVVVCVEKNGHKWLDCDSPGMVPWILKFLLGTLF